MWTNEYTLFKQSYEMISFNTLLCNIPYKRNMPFMAKIANFLKSHPINGGIHFAGTRRLSLLSVA